jgi:tRNA threonylcarbamoyl adenosine modification protein (Sua5/YciO/YrdC/YwlC family)
VIVEWDPARPRKKTTDLIKETLLLGGIIAYPTDTIYGIGCDLFNIKAIKKLYSMKRLDDRRALTIICRDLKEISTYAVMDDFAFEVLKRHLPGPYTFVLKAKRIMPKLMMTDKKEVGIRITDHPIPVGLASLIDHPIINTSARIGEDEVFTDPRQLEKAFQKNISIIIDGGIMSDIPSTVIRVTESEAEVLRQGKGQFKASN